MTGPLLLSDFAVWVNNSWGNGWKGEAGYGGAGYGAGGTSTMGTDYFEAAHPSFFGCMTQADGDGSGVGRLDYTGECVSENSYS